MKKNIFIVVLISILFSLGSKTEALTYGGCEYSKISRLKSIVSNINLSYDEHINIKPKTLTKTQSKITKV